MNYHAFRKEFAKRIGIPPARYRLLRRIDRAKSLVTASNRPIRDIADSLGYCDEYFFSRQFKRVTGTSPGEFRAKFSR